MKIINIVVRNIRFPTSLQQDASDALNQGDYSATCGVLEAGTGHFVDPRIAKNARYVKTLQPADSIDIKPESIADSEFPAGRVWQQRERNLR